MFLRIKHVLENHAQRKQLKVGGRVIDFESMSIIQGPSGAEFLPTRDFQLLELLIHSAPRVVSRDEILNSLWGDENFPTGLRHAKVEFVVLIADELLIEVADLVEDPAANGGEHGSFGVAFVLFIAVPGIADAKLR